MKEYQAIIKMPNNAFGREGSILDYGKNTDTAAFLRSELRDEISEYATLELQGNEYDIIKVQADTLEEAIQSFKQVSEKFEELKEFYLQEDARKIPLLEYEIQK